MVAMPTAMPPSAVDQEVREARRQHDRLAVAAVVVSPKSTVSSSISASSSIASGDRRHSVYAGRGGPVVGRAEVAVPVDQRVPQREVLGHTDEGVVDRLVAVRVVLAHHLADRVRTLAVRPIGTHPLGVHAVEDAAVHRLQTVARRRAVHVT